MITRNGEEVAAVVPVSALRRLRLPEDVAYRRAVHTARDRPALVHVVHIARHDEPHRPA